MRVEKRMHNVFFVVYLCLCLLDYRLVLSLLSLLFAALLSLFPRPHAFSCLLLQNLCGVFITRKKKKVRGSRSKDKE